MALNFISKRGRIVDANSLEVWVVWQVDYTHVNEIFEFELEDHFRAVRVADLQQKGLDRKAILQDFIDDLIPAVVAMPGSVEKRFELIKHLVLETISFYLGEEE